MPGSLFVCKGKFKYLSHTCSINADGEKYVSVSILTDSQSKFSFVSHDEELIKQFQSVKIEAFSDIVLVIGFDRVFNPKTRYSNWQATLLGVE